MEKWSIDKFATKQAEEKKELTPEEIREKIENEKQLYKYCFIKNKDNLHIHILKRENIDQPYKKYYVFTTDADMQQMINFLLEQGYYIAVREEDKKEEYLCYMYFRSPFEIRTKKDFITKNIDLHNLVILVKLFNADLSLNDLERANIMRKKLTSSPYNFIVDHICEQKFNIQNTRSLTGDITYPQYTTDIPEDFKTDIKTPINIYTPQSNNKYNNLVFLKRKRKQNKN